MSLRTKLLAAVIGLPVAVVLLALIVLMRSESTEHTPASAIEHSVRELMREWEAARESAPEGVEGAASRRRHQQALRRFLKRVRELEQQGQFTESFIVLMPRPASEQATFDIWTLSGYLDTKIRGGDDDEPDVRDPELKRQLTEWAQGAFRGGFRFRDSHVALAGRLKVDDRHYVVVARSHDHRAAMRRVYWLLIAGALLLAAIAYWLVSRWVTQPLRQLGDAANRIAHGDYELGIDPQGRTDEFGQALRALNHMSGEIAEYQGHLEDRVMSALGRMKSAEKHLTVAQRLAATGKLAAGLAHEINNPLGGMQNAVRALRRGDMDAEKTEVYLGLIGDGLSRVEQTVKRFLAFSPRRMDARACDLSTVVRKGLALAEHRAERSHIVVKEELAPEGEAMVYGDSNELQQVALNLFLNAVDAVAAQKEPFIHIRVAAQGEEVVLRVDDNGVGMTEEDQERCFDMFFTSKSVGEGTGMGLAVVHTIITNHGGRLELRSQPGEGTSFQVILPREHTEQGSR